MVLLTKHFPTLRILWSRSPYITTELFEDLKRGADDPDLNTKNVLSLDEELDLDYAVTLLQSLPGITPHKYIGFCN
jgi:DNA excision repair protein ERCC-4